MKSEEVKSKIDKPLSRFVDFGGARGIRTLGPLRVYLISSQGRYDHFDIAPYINLQQCYYTVTRVKSQHFFDLKIIFSLYVHFA